jgi:hypothetical protein
MPDNIIDPRTQVALNPMDPATNLIMPVETSVPISAPAVVRSAGEPKAGTQPPEGGMVPTEPAAAAPSSGAENEPTTSLPWEPVPLPDHMTPEEALGAARHFQGRFDKQQKQLAQYERGRPILDALLGDNEALNYLTNRWANQEQGVMPSAPMPANGQAQQTPVATLVELPARPEGLDLYSEEGEKWLASRDEAYAHNARVQAERLERLEGSMRESSQQSAQQRQRETNVQAIRYEAEMTQAEAVEFYNLVDKNGLGPLHATWQDAARAWVSQKRQPSTVQATQRAAEEAAYARAANRLPNTATATVGGQGQLQGADPRQNLIVPSRPTGSIDPFEPVVRRY